MKNLKFVALPVPEIIGGTRKNWTVPGYTPTLPFLQNYSWAFVRMDRMNVSAKLELWGTEKFLAVPGYAHAPFSAKFLWACVRMDPVNICQICSPQLYPFLR